MQLPFRARIPQRDGVLAAPFLAAKRQTSPRKNRVGVFGRRSAHRARKNTAQLPDSRRVAAACGYKSASGRALFINKDPIAERGGLNLYGFCFNDGVNLWDYLGMDPPGMAPYGFGPVRMYPNPTPGQLASAGIGQVNQIITSYNNGIPAFAQFGVNRFNANASAMGLQSSPAVAYAWGFYQMGSGAQQYVAGSFTVLAGGTATVFGMPVVGVPAIAVGWANVALGADQIGSGVGHWGNASEGRGTGPLEVPGPLQPITPLANPAPPTTSQQPAGPPPASGASPGSGYGGSNIGSGGGAGNLGGASASGSSSSTGTNNPSTPGVYDLPTYTVTGSRNDGPRVSVSGSGGTVSVFVYFEGAIVITDPDGIASVMGSLPGQPPLITLPTPLK